MKIIVGIDPGKRGGICAIDENNRILLLKDISSDYELILYRFSQINDEIGYDKIDSIFLESAISVQTNRTINNQLFFMNGFITGVAYALGINVVLTQPGHWKKVIGVTSDKSTSIEKAIHLFPSAIEEITFAHGSYKDGISEALLIAYYGMHLNKFYPEGSQMKEGKYVKNTKAKKKATGQSEIDI